MVKQSVNLSHYNKPWYKLIIRRIQTIFLALAQPKGVYIFITTDAIWLLQLFNPIHITLGKIRCQVGSFWLGLTAVCLVCGFGLVCCIVSATLLLGLNVHLTFRLLMSHIYICVISSLRVNDLNKRRATSTVHQAEVMTIHVLSPLWYYWQTF